MKKLGLIALLPVLVCCVRLSRAEDTSNAPTSQPATDAPVKVDVTDKDAVKAATGKDVVLEGVVDAAAWSGSGKVMKATFKDGGKLSAIIFSKKKDDFDKAFSGDITKALTGSKVRLRGQLKDFKGSPELVLDDPGQVTVLAPAASTQASQ